MSPISNTTRRVVLTAMLLVAVRTGWQLHWEPNPLNVSIAIVTECKGKEPFYAVDAVPILGDMETITTRRQVVPKGERCTVVASVMRNPNGGAGDPDDDYVGESTIVIEVQ